MSLGIHITNFLLAPSSRLVSIGLCFAMARQTRERATLHLIWPAMAATLPYSPNPKAAPTPFSIRLLIPRKRLIPPLPESGAEEDGWQLSRRPTQLIYRAAIWQPSAECHPMVPYFPSPSQERLE